MSTCIERHQHNIAGVLSCFDRVVITGTLPDIAYSGAMQNHLHQKGMRYFDFPGWAEPLRNQLRDFAEALADQSGLNIAFIHKHKAFRKDYEKTLYYLSYVRTFDTSFLVILHKI